MLETRISGIPCLINPTHVIVQKPDYGTWASDQDYYGYSEIEYTVCDRRGRPAPWLEKKMTKEEDAQITDMILNQEQEND